jgi:hypothetical protein
VKPPRLISICSEDTADQVVRSRFLAHTEQQPDLGVWVAYAFRSREHGSREGRPRRMFRLMVHLPGRPELDSKIMLFSWRNWLTWRALTVVCGRHPGLSRLWAGTGGAAR